MQTAEQIQPTEVQSIESDRQLWSVRFSPCGDFLAAGGFDATIKRWKFGEDQLAPLDSFVGHHGWVQAITFHPTADLLFSTDTWGKLCAWRYREQRDLPVWLIEQAHDGWIRAVAVSSDGKQLATAGRDKVIRVWNPETGKPLHEFHGHNSDVFALAFQPETHQLASGDWLGNVKRWNADATKPVHEQHFEKMHHFDRDQDVCGVRVLAFSGDGKTLMVAGSEPSNTSNALGLPTLHYVDAATGEVRHTAQFGAAKDGFVFDIAQHPDGYVMMATSGSPGAGQFLCYREGDEKPFVENKKMYNTHGVAIHPGGKFAVVTATNRSSQGNGAVRDKEGNYVGNTSPVHLFKLA